MSLAVTEAFEEAPPATNDVQEPKRCSARRSKNAAHAEPASEPMWQVHMLPVDQIGPNPMQPREIFDEEELAELTATVAKKGVQSPIVVRTFKAPAAEASEPAKSGTANGSAVMTVRAAAPDDPLASTPKYELVTGERRLRASRNAGRKRIPAFIRDDLTDAEAAEMALVENVQRANLNIMEEARGYKRLMLKFRMSEERIAHKVGKTVPTVQAAIRLLDLPEAVQTMLLRKQLTAAHGHELLRLAPFPEICVAVANKCVSDKITAAALSVHPLPGAQILKRAKSVVELGPHTKFEWRKVCRECPFKALVTSNFATYCLKPSEYRKKQEHAVELAKQEAARILEAAGKQEDGEVDITSMPAGSYRDLSVFPVPTGCSGQCPCRREYVGPNDPTRPRAVCVDPARLKLLVDQDREAQEEAARRRYDAMFDSAIGVLFGGVQNAGPSESMPEADVGQFESDDPGRESDRQEPASNEVASENGRPARDANELPAGSDPDSGSRSKLVPAKAAAIVAARVFESIRYPMPGIWERVVEAIDLCQAELDPDIFNTLEELLYGDVEPEQALRLLAAQDTDTVLVLTAGLLLIEEIDHCLRYREDPARMQFVLGIRSSNQTAMEVETEDGEIDADSDAEIVAALEADVAVDSKGLPPSEEDGMAESEGGYGEGEFHEPSEEYPEDEVGGAPGHPQEQWGYPDLEFVPDGQDEGLEFPDDEGFAEDQDN